MSILLYLMMMLSDPSPFYFLPPVGDMRKEAGVRVASVRSTSQNRSMNVGAVASAEIEVNEVFSERTPVTVLSDSSWSDVVVASDQESVMGWLWEAGVPAELHEQFVSVAWCESHWTPSLTGDLNLGVSRGLMQIHTVNEYLPTCQPEDMYDPINNLRCAMDLQDVGMSQGLDRWAYWSCKPS